MNIILSEFQIQGSEITVKVSNLSSNSHAGKSRLTDIYSKGGLTNCQVQANSLELEV